MFGSMCSAKKLCGSKSRDGRSDNEMISALDVRSTKNSSDCGSAMVDSVPSQAEKLSEKLSDKPEERVEERVERAVMTPKKNVPSPGASVSGRVEEPLERQPTSKSIAQEPNPFDDMNNLSSKVIIGVPRNARDIRHDLTLGNAKARNPKEFERKATEDKMRAQDIKREILNHRQFSQEKFQSKKTQERLRSGESYGESSTRGTERTITIMNRPIENEDWEALATCVTGDVCLKDDQPLTKIGHETRIDQRPPVHVDDAHMH